MSRAFVKEDVDPPQRSGRARTASGLPPGTANYMTTRGVQRLRDELAELRRGRSRSYRIIGVDELELYADAVSWISSIGRALLAAEIGERVNIGNDRVEVAGVEYSAY